MEKVISGFVLNLFYPWIDATLNLAYSDYQKSHQFNYFVKSYSVEVANKVFHETVIEDYMKKAFFKNWKTIVFRPWSIAPNHERFVGLNNDDDDC